MTTISRDLTGSMAPKEASVSALRRGPSKPRPICMYRLWGKRAFDLIIMALSVPFWGSAIFFGALAIVVLDRQSPFYTQQRVGRDGKLFRIWKLQTMVADAEACLAAHLAANPAAKAEWDAKQKLEDDPRVNRAGKFLRKTSLDELPQLFNVVRGEMSVVGPRPMLPDQRELYTGERYYQMRPGLTGLWQVSERNKSEFIDRVRFDNRYYATQSLKTDVTVLFKTVGVILRGTGC